jgi:hypothetical protein
VKELVDLYIKQWKRNRRFVKTIDATYLDWQVNLVFYIALHAVNAALASLNITVTNHSARNREVKENGALVGIRDPYAHLYRISCITRYDPDPDSWIPAKYLSVNDLAEDLLKPVENGVGAIVGAAVKYEPLNLKM